jgi:hypothetical protein
MDEHTHTETMKLNEIKQIINNDHIIHLLKEWQSLWTCHDGI